MDGECGANNIALTEKHETEEKEKDEINKAMELFGLADKEKGNKDGR